MMSFIFLSYALLAMMIWLIAPALFGRQITNFDDAKQLNINIARERLAELEMQLTNGEVDQNQYDQIRNEVESSLLEDTDKQKDSLLTTELSPRYKRNILILLTTIPFIAFGLYQYWGSPETLVAPTLSSAQTTNLDDPQSKHNNGLAAAITQLETRLQQEPNNPDDWYMLARSYVSQKEYTKSVAAYRKLRTLVGDHPAVLLGLADTLTMSRNGDINGEPFELAKKALALEPNNPTALWLSAMGYRHNGKLLKAIELWQQLLPQLSDDPKSGHEVRALIANAQQQAGINVEHASANPNTPPKDIATARLTVKVTLDASLRTRLAGTDYVLIYAQRVTGMKAPLAIVKKQVKDLPITVTLDDSHSIGPMGKLSDVPQVNILARISKTGQAMKQSGDIEVKTGPYINNHADPIEIIIK